MKKFLFYLFCITSISANAVNVEKKEQILKSLTPENAYQILAKTCYKFIVPGFEQYFDIKLSSSDKKKHCSCYVQNILDEFSWNETKLIAIGDYDAVYNRQNRVDKIFNFCFIK